MRRFADAALFVLLATAPLAGGGYRTEALWLLHGLAAVAFFTGLFATQERAIVPPLAVALVVLAVLTGLQAVPLSPSLVEILSSEVVAVWRLAGRSDAVPVSYEPGASYRETSKLILYAVSASAAAAAARRADSLRPIAWPLALAGIGSAGVALIHRALGIERFFGLISPMAGRADRVLTTFVNPNHGAAFLVMASFAAVGLALEARTRSARAGFLAISLIGVAVAVLLLSKSGLLALAVSTVALGLAGRRQSWGREGVWRAMIAATVVGVVLLAAAIALRPSVAWMEVTGGGSDVLGVSAKLAAVRDVGPLVADHLLTGIGRGAFVSVYPRYQTSPLQLTFYFPESLPAQLLAEWGAVIGSIAFVGLVMLAILRLTSARRPLQTALIAGVVGVLVHELFDFSLEMPAMALFLVTVLAPGLSRSESGGRVGRLVMGLAVGALLVTSTLSLREAERASLDADLALLDSAIASEPPVSLDVVEEVALRHPASALVATRLAFLAEQQDPPRLKAAIRHANRALLLAPRQAGAYLLTGRLLVHAGHRRQAFEMLRRAWSLSGADRRTEYIGHIVDLARRPAELLTAVPRSDPVADQPDGAELARLVTVLALRGRPDWARATLARAPRVADLSGDELTVLARSASLVGNSTVTQKLLVAQIQRRPDDIDARVRLTRLLLRAGDLEQAERTLEEVGLEADPRVGELRAHLALARRDWAAARAALEDMRAARRLSLARLARLAAEVEMRAGQPDRAVRVLDEALAVRPGTLGLRVLRAELLIGLDRLAGARLDVEYVLRRDPQHAGARRLKTRLSGARRLP